MNSNNNATSSSSDLNYWPWKVYIKQAVERSLLSYYQIHEIDFDDLPYFEGL